MNRETRVLGLLGPTWHRVLHGQAIDFHVPLGLQEAVLWRDVRVFIARDEAANAAEGFDPPACA